MPVVDIWDRRVLPQGGLSQVGGTSGGEMIGRGIENVGQAAESAAMDLTRAKMIIDKRNGDAWAGQQKPQMVLDADAFIKDLNDPNSKSYVDPIKADEYTGAVNKYFDDYQKKLSKAAPTPDSQAELNAYTQAQKADYLRTSNRYVAESQYANRISNIDESNRKSGAVLVAHPSMFDQVAQQQEALIRGQGLSQLQADEQVRNMKANMARFAMNGEAEANPRAFLKSAESWGEKGADPAHIAQAKNIADSVIKQQDAQAKADRAHAQAVLKSNTTDRVNDALSSLTMNGGVMPMEGGVPLIDNATIDRAWADDPVMAARVKQKVRNAQVTGQTIKELDGATRSDAIAKLESLAPTGGGTFTADQADLYKTAQGVVKAKIDASNAEISSILKDSQGAASDAWAEHGKDWVQTAYATQSVPEDAYAAIAEMGDPAKQQQIRAQLDEAVKLGGIEKQLPKLTASELGAVLSNLDADAAEGGTGSAAAAAMAEAVRKPVLDKLAAFDGADPAGAAVTYNSGAAGAWQAWQDAMASNDEAAAQVAFQNAVGVTDQEMDRQEVPLSRRPPLPKAVAVGMAQSIAAQPNPKAMIAAIKRTVIPNNPQMTARIAAQLTSVEGGMPVGMDLVIDVLDPMSNGGEGGDEARAERMISAAYANTKGITIEKSARDTMAQLLQQGMVGTLATLADKTGDSTMANSLAQTVNAAVTQAAMAKISLGMDETQAVTEAVADWTGQYQYMNDPSLAAVYYPKAAEEKAPGALEAGFIVMRREAAMRLDPGGRVNPVDNKKISNTAEDIMRLGVWVPQGDGFRLIVPGSTRTLAEVSLTDAQQRGLAALAAHEVSLKPAPPGGAGSAFAQPPTLPVRP